MPFFCIYYVYKGYTCGVLCVANKEIAYWSHIYLSDEAQALLRLGFYLLRSVHH